MILFKLLINSWLHHQKENATPKQKKPYNTKKTTSNRKTAPTTNHPKKTHPFSLVNFSFFYLTFPRMVGSALSNGAGHLPVVSVKVQRHCPGDVRRSRRSGSRRKRLRLRWHRRKRRGPGVVGGGCCGEDGWGGFLCVCFFGWVGKGFSYMVFEELKFTKKPGKDFDYKEGIYTWMI